MVCIYVLELTNSKYYVGKTNNFDARIRQHQSNQYSCAWVTKYQFIKLVEAYDNCDSFDEDKLVKIYMYRYGINNVRGGAYINERLPNYQLKSLKKELYNITGQCFRCGELNHFISNCGNPLNDSIVLNKELVDISINHRYFNF